MNINKMTNCWSKLFVMGVVVFYGTTSLISAVDITKPVQNGNKAKYEKCHKKQLDDARKVKPKVLFIGDSITAMLRFDPIWNKKFKSLKAANLGISGDKTQNVLWRLQNGNWGKIKPKVIVLMIGVNNGDKGSTLAKAQEVVITKINEKFPKVKIIFIPVLPIIRKKSKNKETIIFKSNSESPAFEKKFSNVKVLDISEKFLNTDGTQKAKLYKDGVHLTEKGNKVWASEIVPVIKKLLRGK